MSDFLVDVHRALNDVDYSAATASADAIAREIVLEEGMRMSIVTHASHFLRHHLIWFLIASYVVAAAVPGPGLAIRSVSLGGIHLPMLLLGILLFNAGMGVDFHSLKQLGNHPRSLGWGLAANLFIPIIFIGLVMIGMSVWHNSDEVQNILVGLALVASMPIAGSSTAWSQNLNGNLTLSLGLVMGSTFLSPVTTPIALHSVGLMTTGDYSTDLHALAGTTTGWFLLVSVIVPTILGITTRAFLSAAALTTAMPRLKLMNCVILLILNYANAAVSLPQAFSNPDLDFLGAILGITLLLCSVAFFSGWLIAKCLRSNRSDQVALMFGLGMNNNGTGLVLASMSLADHPRVLLPIIFYNLVQHLIAGSVNQFVCSRRV